MEVLHTYTVYLMYLCMYLRLFAFSPLLYRSLASVSVSKTKYVVWTQDMHHVAIYTVSHLPCTLFYNVILKGLSKLELCLFYVCNYSNYIAYARTYVTYIIIIMLKNLACVI